MNEELVRARVRELRGGESMKKLAWAFSIASAVACANLVVAGCGSETSSDIPPADGGGDESSTNPSDDGATPPPPSDSGFIDAIVDGGRDPDAAICKLNGDTCTSSLDCCTANCADGDGGKVCGDPIGLCKPAGQACATGNECCTFSCIAGTCSNKLCVADDGACGSDAECCGGSCVPDGKGGGVCKPLNASCKTSGNPCAANGDCCSKFCNGGVCNSQPSFCTQDGDVCSTDLECCGGACTKAAGATLGTCGAVTAPGTTGCTPAGQSCGAGTDGGVQCDQSCCSRSCGPLTTPIKVCEPPSGCHPTGELCRSDDDCCGNPKQPPPLKGPVHCSKASPTQAFGRCDNGGACREPGSICKVGGTASCSAENNCCEPNGAVGKDYCNSNPANCCKQDALGIPRCVMNAYDCAGGPPPAGTSCATSADCCGNPCVANKFGGACVPNGGSCSTSADCCPGLPCAIPPGGSVGVCGGTVLDDGGVAEGGAPDGGPGTDGGGNLPDGGTCSLYGQTCDPAANDCCNAVPCVQTNTGAFTCHFP
jgi:hypothetical protein